MWPVNSKRVVVKARGDPALTPSPASEIATFTAKVDQSIDVQREATVDNANHGPKRWRYSIEVMKALTISASIKLPLNWSSLASQKL